MNKILINMDKSKYVDVFIEDSMLAIVADMGTIRFTRIEKLKIIDKRNLTRVKTKQQTTKKAE